MRRVLRPAGRAVVLEFSTPPFPLFRGVYLWYFHRVLPWIGRLVSGHPSAYTYLPASVGDFPSPQGLTQWMEEAGFSAVSYRLLTGGIVAIHVGVKPDRQLETDHGPARLPGRPGVRADG